MSGAGNQFHVVSFSGGKDSTAMLLGMLERKMPIDAIIFCDTGMEFPEMYDHIDLVEKRIQRPITRLKAELSFEYYLSETPCAKTARLGYQWSSPLSRWCTRVLKDEPKAAYLRTVGEGRSVIEYVGLAADETRRMERKCNRKENKRYPLADWGMTEDDALRYCYDHGYDWGGLYRHHKRVSCWCCPLQSLRALRSLYRYHPELWRRLRAMDDREIERGCRKFRPDYSVAELEMWFAAEEKQQRLSLGEWKDGI